MLRPVAVVKIDVSEESIAFIISNFSQPVSVASYCYRFYLANSSHPDDGGDRFFRNGGSYKNHAA
jgi:hypothetical protein